MIMFVPLLRTDSSVAELILPHSEGRPPGVIITSPKLLPPALVIFYYLPAVLGVASVGWWVDFIGHNNLIFPHLFSLRRKRAVDVTVNTEEGKYGRWCLIRLCLATDKGPSINYLHNKERGTDIYGRNYKYSKDDSTSVFSRVNNTAYDVWHGWTWFNLLIWVHANINNIIILMDGQWETLGKRSGGGLEIIIRIAIFNLLHAQTIIKGVRTCVVKRSKQTLVSW